VKLKIKVLSHERPRKGSTLFFCILLQATGLAQIDAEPSGDVYFVKSANDMQMIKVSVREDGNPISFLMGSDSNEQARLPDENQHQVFLSKDYYLGKYEVTQTEYAAVMRNNKNGYESRPSNFSKTETRPVESISWDEANHFVELLNQKERDAGRLSRHWSYSLPTEAEWEFACRAGTTSAFSTGDQVSGDQANFLLNESNQTSVVGKFDPNAWGFHDMHGNVKEWCRDWYQDYYQGSFVDPKGVNYVKDSNGNYLNPFDFFEFHNDSPPHLQSSMIPKKVCRGGGFDTIEVGLRSARRYQVLPNSKLINLGFRLALRKEESSADLETSLTCNVVNFQASESYRVETSWEDSPRQSILISSGEEIGNFLSESGIEFEDDFSVRTIYSTNYGAVLRPEADGSYSNVPTLAYEINATGVDSNGQNTSYVREISLDELMTFIQVVEPDLVNTENYALIDSNSSFYSGTVGFIHFRTDSFSERISQFLEEGDFLGNSQGWVKADWFGYYFADFFPWIFHENLGWAYVSQNQDDNAWLYRENLGWAWTSTKDWWNDFQQDSASFSKGSHEFPYLYRYGNDENDTKVWTYLNRNLADTTLYDFNRTEWFLMDQPYDINITILPQDGGLASGSGQYYRWQNVSLQASSNINYKFIKWDDDKGVSSSDYAFLATQNKSFRAVFFPLVSADLSPAMRVNSYKEIINGMSGLTAQQKEWALAELLVFGRSDTAGIP
jgi:formylglycine-generating enzyme required for sulfatase activity